MIIVENERKVKNKKIKVGDIIKTENNTYYLIILKKSNKVGYVNLTENYDSEVSYNSIKELLDTEFDSIKYAYETDGYYTHIPSEEFKLTIY